MGREGHLHLKVTIRVQSALLPLAEWPCCFPPGDLSVKQLGEWSSNKERYLEVEGK